MSNLTISLDDVLNATANGSGGGFEVVNEQHDASKIDWQAATGDLAEMVKRGKSETMAQAAQRRAGIDMTGGRANVVTVGELPWHKLGTTVNGVLTAEQCCQLAGLGFKVGTVELARRVTVDDGIMSFETITNSSRARAVVRLDTMAEIGVVGPKYKPIQNDRGFKFLDSIRDKFGATYEAAGSLDGGSRVFMLLKFPGLGFSLAGDDVTDAYGLFTNAHDGSEAGRFMPTGVRVVCKNTHRIARKGGKGKGWSFRHVGNVEATMDEAQSAIMEAADQFKTAGEEARVMASTNVPVQNYLNDILDAVADVTAANALKGADVLAAMIAADEAERKLAEKSFARKITRRGELLADMMERLESDRCAVNGQHGTAWSVYNAVSESVDHGQLGGRFNGTETAKATRRFDSVLAGKGDDVKQLAYEKALAFAK